MSDATRTSSLSSCRDSRREVGSVQGSTSRVFPGDMVEAWARAGACGDVARPEAWGERERLVDLGDAY